MCFVSLSSVTKFRVRELVDGTLASGFIQAPTVQIVFQHAGRFHLEAVIHHSRSSWCSLSLLGPVF